jgi:hypothetical protein
MSGQLHALAALATEYFWMLLVRERCLRLPPIELKFSGRPTHSLGTILIYAFLYMFSKIGGNYI